MKKKKKILFEILRDIEKNCITNNNSMSSSVNRPFLSPLFNSLETMKTSNDFLLTLAYKLFDFKMKRRFKFALESATEYIYLCLICNVHLEGSYFFDIFFKTHLQHYYMDICTRLCKYPYHRIVNFAGTFYIT